MGTGCERCKNAWHVRVLSHVPADPALASLVEALEGRHYGRAEGERAAAVHADRKEFGDAAKHAASADAVVLVVGTLVQRDKDYPALFNSY